MANQHTAPLDRSAIVGRYLRNRQRSRAIFDLLADTAYYSQPIALRHPIVFYEGHLPGFSFNTLVKKALGLPSIDARLEALFARGIDPHEAASHQPSASARSSGAASDGGPAEAWTAKAGQSWPSRETVRAFTDEADRRVVDALQRADLDQPGHPLLDRAEAVFAILEHEEMHQETLLYMWHRLPFDQKTRPASGDDAGPHAAGASPRQEWIQVPAGCATLGVARESATFGWDNEFPAYSVQVPAFR